MLFGISTQKAGKPPFFKVLPAFLKFSLSGSYTTGSPLFSSVCPSLGFFGCQPSPIGGTPFPISPRFPDEFPSSCGRPGRPFHPPMPPKPPVAFPKFVTTFVKVPENTSVPFTSTLALLSFENSAEDATMLLNCFCAVASSTVFPSI